MLRYSNQRFLGDHFNFEAQDTSNGILDEGVWGKPKLSPTFGDDVKNNLVQGNVLIDENIDLRPYFAEFSLETTEAARSQPRNGHKLCIWHSVRLSKKLAETYRDANVDYVFLEEYWPFRSRLLLWLFFKWNWYVAKRAGIRDRIVYGLGINQSYSKFNWKDINSWWGSIPWCNDEKTLNAQLTYIRNKCPGIAGIAYYVASADSTFMKLVDAKTFDLFPDAPRIK